MGLIKYSFWIKNINVKDSVWWPTETVSVSRTDPPCNRCLAAVEGVGVPERSTIRGGKARRAGRGRKLIRGA